MRILPRRRKGGWLERHEWRLSAGGWSLRLTAQRKVKNPGPQDPIDVQARLQRRIAHLERIALGHAEKCERLKSEVRKLEDTLAWVYRKSPEDWPKVQAVIVETIPRRLARASLPEPQEGSST